MPKKEAAEGTRRLVDKKEKGKNRVSLPTQEEGCLKKDFSFFFWWRQSQFGTKKEEEDGGNNFRLLRQI